MKSLSPQMAKYLPLGENLTDYGKVSEWPRSLTVGLSLSPSLVSSLSSFKFSVWISLCLTHTTFPLLKLAIGDSLPILSTTVASSKPSAT